MAASYTSRLTLPAQAMQLHIGLDLDNTIIDFDKAFGEVGAEIGLLPPDHGLITKDAVKAFLRTPPHVEEDWMRLQGQVYGRHIGRARLYDGVAECVRAMRQRGVRISIVSHKTRHGHFDAARVGLWDAAQAWLEGQGFFSAEGFGLDRADLHFSETRAGKIATITRIGCRAFVDDLAEVLCDPQFPPGTERIWFAADKDAAEGAGLVPYRDWIAIARRLEELR
jgi:hypothetical protein